VLSVEGLEVRFRYAAGLLRRRSLPALEAVTVSLGAGESLGVVGESGCGKTTLTRAALRLIRAERGQVLWLGQNPARLSARRIRGLRRDLQLIFQDPLGSLDPHLSVEQLVSEPLEIHQSGLGPAQRRERVHAMLARVGLEPALYARRVHELSGGQCQRVGIARAMILAPRLLVCDEPLSALDVRAQRQIRLLLTELSAEQRVSLLFVSHDLALVRHLCERALVLYLGRMVELGPTDELFARPLHPYTRELIEAIALPDPDLQPARLAKVRLGEARRLEQPGGCAFRLRCAHATAVCAERIPPWVSAGEGRWVACHHFGDWADGMLSP
jgi:oligopeptide transport system ATP-binding protein